MSVLIFCTIISPLGINCILEGKQLIINIKNARLRSELKKAKSEIQTKTQLNYYKMVNFIYKPIFCAGG